MSEYLVSTAPPFQDKARLIVPKITRGVKTEGEVLIHEIVETFGLMAIAMLVFPLVIGLEFGTGDYEDFEEGQETEIEFTASCNW